MDSQEPSTEKRKHNLVFQESNSSLCSPTKRPRIFTTINELPNEILIEIFSLVPKRDLVLNLRFVCTHWYKVTYDRCVWNMIDIDETVPVQVVNHWLATTPELKHLYATNRTDTDHILRRVSEQCKKLEALTLIRCWGTRTCCTVHSKCLCYFVSKLPYLRHIKFNTISFNSCKFFKLLVADETNNKLKNVHYEGPMTPKQLAVYLTNNNEL